MKHNPKNAIMHCEKGLVEHLQRAEIEYIATHGGGYPESFSFDSDIEVHLRRLGFRIKEKYNTGLNGEQPQWWALTTNNIAVHLGDGFLDAHGAKRHSISKK